MSESSPTIEQFRKELLLIKVMYIKLFTFVINEAKCKAAGYNYYGHYFGKASDYTQHAYTIGFVHTNPKYYLYDRLNIDISKHSEKLYSIEATFNGEIFKNFFKYALKHYNKVITTEILDIFTDIRMYVEAGRYLYERYLIRTYFETSHNNPVGEFDPISVINDMKISFAYTYLYPGAGIGFYNNKADMSALTVERLSLFNNLLDDIIRGIKNNTYIT